MAKVIADAGPLVAYLTNREHYHDWARVHMECFEPPLLTCEPVLTEASFLLARQGFDPGQLLTLLERGVLQIGFAIQEYAGPLRKLMQRYRNVPMSLADACLVLLSEMHDGATVWTLDSHFSVYRRQGRRIISTLMPP